jgi:hypothetical protein
MDMKIRQGRMKRQGKEEKEKKKGFQKKAPDRFYQIISFRK